MYRHLTGNLSVGISYTCQRGERTRISGGRKLLVPFGENEELDQLIDKSDQSVMVYLHFLLSDHVCLHSVIGLRCAAMCYKPCRN